MTEVQFLGITACFCQCNIDLEQRHMQSPEITFFSKISTKPKTKKQFLNVILEQSLWFGTWFWNLIRLVDCYVIVQLLRQHAATPEGVPSTTNELRKWSWYHVFVIMVLHKSNGGSSLNKLRGFIYGTEDQFWKSIVKVWRSIDGTNSKRILELYDWFMELHS